MVRTRFRVLPLYVIINFKEDTVKDFFILNNPNKNSDMLIRFYIDDSTLQTRYSQKNETVIKIQHKT